MHIRQIHPIPAPLERPTDDDWMRLPTGVVLGVSLACWVWLPIGAIVFGWL